MSLAVDAGQPEALAGGRLRRWAVPGWILFLSALVLLPVFAPGFVLGYDMVFTPDQTLLPWMLGVDSGLPRAAPEDAVVSLIAGPLPGMLLQKVALFAIPLLAGFGVWRLLKELPLLIQAAAVALIIWNPFVAQRLLIGHWALLLSYAAAPWVLLYAAKVRAGRSSAPGESAAGGSAAGGLVLFVALGSLVPTGGLFMALLVVPVIFWRSKATALARMFVGVCVVLFLSTWLIPAISSQSASASDGAAIGVFGLEAQSWGGPWLAALGLGGIWNSQATLTSGGLPWMPLVALVFVVLAVLGFRRLAQAIDRVLVVWLTVLAVTGYIAAVAGALFGETALVQSLVADVPGFGLLRDGQKLLAPLAVFVALAAPLGVAEILGRRASVAKNGARAALAALIVAPLALMPDLAFGAFGRLAPNQYPSQWGAVRDAIASSPSGDAVSVPWSTFRRYRWNSDRPVLDPAPRYMTTTVITDDRLSVSRAGKQFVVAGDNPRSEIVGQAVNGTVPLAQVLPPLGIRWVIEQADQPQGLDRSRFGGLTLVVDGSDLRLWQVPGDIALSEADVPLGVVGANLAAGFALVVAAGVAVGGLRARESRRKG